MTFIIFCLQHQEPSYQSPPIYSSYGSHSFAYKYLSDPKLLTFLYYLAHPIMVCITFLSTVLSGWVLFTLLMKLMLQPHQTRHLPTCSSLWMQSLSPPETTNVLQGSPGIKKFLERNMFEPLPELSGGSQRHIVKLQVDLKQNPKWKQMKLLVQKNKGQLQDFS